MFETDTAINNDIDSHTDFNDYFFFHSTPIFDHLVTSSQETTDSLLCVCVCAFFLSLFLSLTHSLSISL